MLVAKYMNLNNYLMTKVAVIGNKEWQNRRKIQHLLTDLKHKFKNDLILIGAGGKEV